MKMVRTIISAATATAKSEINNKYEEAVKALNTLQTNAQTLEKIRSERDRYAHLNIPNMLNFAARAGISEEAMDSLNVVHISGTKGKGSTCAFCESILRSHGFKTGFYSSPHLVEVRERFRINGQPMHRDSFASYFWDVYTKLEESKEMYEGKMPNYFGFLTVMALHVFLQEKVDVAIMEVGIGGQYDCTNLIKHPVVCGVSSLGLDHTSILGTTIDKIAWHKAGIFKSGVPAFTAPQQPKAMEVLKNRALEIGVPLTVCPDLREYDSGSRPLQLGINGSMQRVNASLALQISNLWINRVKDRALSSEVCVIDDEDIKTAEAFQLSSHMIQGLEHCSWRGRNQKLSKPGITYYLDGAHTLESIQQCVEWFHGEMCLEGKKRKQGCYKVLIFNTTGDRDTSILLEPLQNTHIDKNPNAVHKLIKVCDFDAVLFCPNAAFLSCNSADQNNRNVTKESQINRCLSNKHAWEKLSHEKSIKPNISKKVAVSVDMEPPADSGFDHVAVNGFSIEQQSENIVTNHSMEAANKKSNVTRKDTTDTRTDTTDTRTDTTDTRTDTTDSTDRSQDAPTNVKRPRKETVIMNGYHVSIEKDGENADLNCNHNNDLNLNKEVVVDDVSDNHLVSNKKPVIHAFPSISHCIEWIMKGIELRYNAAQGGQLGENVQNVVYDSNRGDLEDSDKTLPEIGDKHVNILVTGSLHLVGGALRVIEGESACS